MPAYKIRASSVIHPGNYLLEGVDGSCYVFFADVGELSATAIDGSLVEAMVQSYEWSTARGGGSITLEELQVQSSAPIPTTSPGENLVQSGD